MYMCACLLHACMNIQYGSRCLGAENIPGVHKCRISVFKAENCPIQEYCILYAKSHPECNHTTRTSPEWMLFCDVVIM